MEIVDSGFSAPGRKVMGQQPYSALVAALILESTLPVQTCFQNSTNESKILGNKTLNFCFPELLSSL